ncbi:MAG: amphi-Trp domain-containing protein [Deltaproteobacteria bacterium]|nr:amphi-Trp domain-containing protein [Deltaproteobacteria bacterium]
MDGKKFSHVSLQDTNSIKLYFESLIEALDKKKITLLSGEEKIVMAMGDLCRISIQAKKKGLENKLTIKLSWTDVGGPSELSREEIEIF